MENIITAIEVAKMLYDKMVSAKTDYFLGCANLDDVALAMGYYEGYIMALETCSDYDKNVLKLVIEN